MSNRPHPDECPTVAQAREAGDTFPGLHDREAWLVLPIRNGRDADALERSNWRIILADLGGEDVDTLEVHRWHHWAVGWYELALIHPSRRAAADAWRKALNDYPVADDMDHSDLEWEEANA